MAIVSSGSRGTNRTFGGVISRSGSSAGGSLTRSMGKQFRQVYGPSTVWRDGVAYPNSHWAEKKVMPIEDPAHPGRWVDPDLYNRSKARKNQEASHRASQTLASQREPDISEGPNNAGYVTEAGMTRGNTGRKRKNDVSNAVSSGINSVTGVFSNEASRVKSGAEAARQAYRNEHKESLAPAVTKYTGNRVGETLAGIRGGLGSTAAANAARNEVSNIRSGAQAAMDEYDASHKRRRTYTRDKDGKMVYTGETGGGNAVGRALAGVKGGVANSAVGRAGKAAFNALTSKIDDFKNGVDYYLTGMFAKNNREKALSDLKTKAGNLMGAIGSALGNLTTSEGRKQTMTAAGDAISTTLSGVASGIANSDIGKAAINAGKNAYGAVKGGVGKALNSIADFFKGIPGKIKAFKDDMEFKNKAKNDRHVSSHRVQEA